MGQFTCLDSAAVPHRPAPLDEGGAPRLEPGVRVGGLQKKHGGANTGPGRDHRGRHGASQHVQVLASGRNPQGPVEVPLQEPLLEIGSRLPPARPTHAHEPLVQNDASQAEVAIATGPDGFPGPHLDDPFRIHAQHATEADQVTGPLSQQLLGESRRLHPAGNDHGPAHPLF